MVLKHLGLEPESDPKGNPTQSLQIWSFRLDNFLTRRDDKIQISLYSFVSAILIATDCQWDQEALSNLKRFVLVLCLKHGTDKFTSLYKDLINRYQNTAFDSAVQNCPTIDRITDSSMQELWQLMKAVSPRIGAHHVEANAEELWTVSHLAQTRFLPVPSTKKAEEKLFEYISGMTTDDKSSSPERVKGSYYAGRAAGHKILQMKQKLTKENRMFYNRDVHLSLTSGSCWEASRNMAGKWHILKEDGEFIEFLETPVSNLYESETEDHVLDRYGNKICEIVHRSLPIWQIAYSKTPVEGLLGEELETHLSFDGHIKKGFDARMGQLIFAWATEKYLDFRQLGRNLRSKLITIIEPGGKIRPLTSGETWMYLYCVPASHFLKSELMLIPGARVGLSESDHLYRFGRSYAKNQVEGKSSEDGIPVEKTQEWISSSDLTSATDRAYHDQSKELIAGLVEKLGEKSEKTGFTDYIRNCVDLTCSPRDVYYKLSKRRAKHFRKVLGDKVVLVKDYPDGDDDEIVTRPQGRKATLKFTTTRGVLMGDPITKSILTCASISAYLCARRGFTDVSQVNDYELRRRTYLVVPVGLKASNGKKGKAKPGEMYACCGDDHTTVGSLELVSRVPAFQETMGYQISWEKYRISRKYVHYCQGFGFHPKYRAKIAMDTIKIRLLNQFQKTGQNSFEFPDCLVGKAKELWRSLGFQADSKFLDIESKDYLKDLIPIAMRTGMPCFFENKLLKKDLTYFPPGEGGLGVPSRFDYTKSEKYKELCLHRQACAEYPEEMVSTRPGTATAWSRGLEFRTELVNFLSIIGAEVENIKDTETLFSETESVMTADSASTQASRRRVWRTILHENIDISKPQSLIGTKEAVYSEHFLGSAKTATVQRKRRARHKIRDLERQISAHKDVVRSLYPEGTVKTVPLDKRGMWVNRKTLQAWLGVGPVTPSLFWHKRYFDGEARLFDVEVSSLPPEESLTPIHESELPEVDSGSM